MNNNVFVVTMKKKLGLLQIIFYNLQFIQLYGESTEAKSAVYIINMMYSVYCTCLFIFNVLNGRKKAKVS